MLKDGLFKSSSFRKTFSDSRKRIHISQRTLNAVAEEFLLEHSTNILLPRIAISRYMIFQVLTFMKTVITSDVPEVFEETVEVDETYLSGYRKNKRLLFKHSSEKAKRGKGTTKQTVFGILCRNGSV